MSVIIDIETFGQQTFNADGEYTPLIEGIHAAFELSIVALLVLARAIMGV